MLTEQIEAYESRIRELEARIEKLGSENTTAELIAEWLDGIAHMEGHPKYIPYLIRSGAWTDSPSQVNKYLP